MADFYAALPMKRMGAGILLSNATGRVLLVRPTYKPTWEIPGGVVEIDESPRDCVARELVEERGSSLPVGRLLCIDWVAAGAPKTEGLMLIYDGGLIADRTADTIRLPADELSEYRFADLESSSNLISDRMARRLRAALTARHDGTVADLQDGHLVQIMHVGLSAPSLG
jgi:8-oxo-dGTP diphosphatase